MPVASNTVEDLSAQRAAPASEPLDLGASEYSFDITEAQRRVEHQLALVVERLGRREASAEDGKWSEPNVGSSLAHDDSRTPYDPVSYQAHFFLIVAQDNLSAIGELLDAVGVLPVALYALARAAIESAAYGIWILQGGTHAKRVKRSLQLSYDAQESLVDIVRAAGGTHDPEPVYAELNELKRRVKGIGDSADLSKLPTISDILRDVDRDVRIEPATALEAWRICSGMTHANRAVFHALSANTAADGDTRGRSEASLAILATVLIAAVTLRDRLTDRIVEAGRRQLR